MNFVPQPPSSYSVVPLDDMALCSSILDSTLVVNEDEATDGVGVAQPIYVVIHEEYDWELEHQHSTKDDSLLSEPPPFFPDIFGEPAIHDFACVSSSMNAPIIDHPHDTSDVLPPSDNREDKLFIKNPLDLSSAFNKNIEDEFFCFSFTPLFDLSDHEDADEIIEFSNHGYRDPFTSVFDHDDDSIKINFSKPPIYDDLFDDEVETPQIFEALQPELMVMSSPPCPEVGFTSNQDIVQSPEAPHHSYVCIKYPSHTNIMLPPLKLHNPIAHALEEYYIASTCAQHKLSLFLSFSCMSQSRVCICFKVHAVSHSTVKSPRTTCHVLALTYVLWTL